MNILFPGRHHVLTNFQYEYLSKIISEGIQGEKVETLIFAVTSANHENTRRNPVPLYLRTLMIEKFSKNLGCNVKIYPIADVKPTQKFATYLLKQIQYQWGGDINPSNTVLACSTPSIVSMFSEIGFGNLPVELNTSKDEEVYSSLRPFEILNLLVDEGDNWKEENSKWRKYASSASQEVYDEYDLGSNVLELNRDSLLTQDADITETRDYVSYAAGMDNVISLKFSDINPFVKEGKIVDVGSASGSLIKLLATEYPESDIIGIEASRKFYDYARSQDYDSPLVFFYRRNITDQNFKPNSVNTFIYSSVMHEVYSYIGEDVLQKILSDAYSQLCLDGRIIIRDVVGPVLPDREVYMSLNQDDGLSEGDIRQLSTYARFFRFAQDFIPRRISFELVEDKRLIKLSIRDAYEFISKMSYVDNWQSEMHEEFGFYSFEEWKSKLISHGFRIVPGSQEFSNPYIIEKKYKGKVSLYDMEMKEVNYPHTNMILVGEK